MRTSTFILALAAGAAAFPHIPPDALKRATAAAPQGAGYLPANPPPFDAKSQLVSTSGTHAFVAPGSTDARGPCPGLNAAANHGYLPHNGVATIAQFIQGTHAVFGMAPDLAGFLAIYGAIVDGDGSSWSIGGVPRTGISGSHHNYECDDSPLKADLNQYGSNVQTIDSQFYELYNMQPNAATANYNLEVLSTFRGNRFRESVAKNPYFYFGPFDGIAVSQAAFSFIYRFMSNKSAEYPEGILNKAVLKSFMSYSGPENKLVHTPGNERIPDNWYRRNDADLYTIPYFITDIIQFAKQTPEIISVGCNTGTVNSYQHFGLDNLLGGSASSLSKTPNPLCASLQLLSTAGQSMLGLNSNQAAALKKAAASAASQTTCTLNNLFTPNVSALKSCPGFTIYGGPTGPVAPGAIQS